MAWGFLARIMHKISTASPPSSVVLTVLHSVGLLDVLQEYACGAFPSRALSGLRLRRFVTRTYAESGLGEATPILLG